MCVEYRGALVTRDVTQLESHTYITGSSKDMCNHNSLLFTGKLHVITVDSVNLQPKTRVLSLSD